ncbi:putative baseplate assembly protein [Leptolyngbya sp. FACHB-16]|uniref:putative baseplate assembly protein n=1 Tax=unclassified Leptolyngbya TaxID=2650499 RepID=UPI001689F7B3|nr:putative baseplate assembly protein [Leptolyngbya sp. FACHB-16]MBD2158530.1 putative baseplate assembly protein [Leptolyngbya sp. FACHB-16]
MNTDPPEFGSAEVPEIHNNAPGKSAIAYRYGTHATILQRLLSRLHQQEIPGSETTAPTRPLQALSIHDRDDPAIALLDSWAVVADVLSFYQERIANEGYLRTAIEDRSVLELSKAIGYGLRPGVAASAPLVFTVEDSPGSEPAVLIPQGTQVQSIPTQPGEQPQTFETVSDFEARAEWNCIIPYLHQEEAAKQTIKQDTSQLKLQGTNTLLQPGDIILIVGDERKENEASNKWYVGTVAEVEPNLQANYTQITWNLDVLTPSANLRAGPPANPEVFVLRQRAALFGYNAPQSSYTMIQGEGTISSGTGSAGRGTVSGDNTLFKAQLKVGDIIIAEDNQTRSIVSINDAGLIVDAPFNPALNQKRFSFIRPGDIRTNPRVEGTQINLNAAYLRVLSNSWILLSQPELSNGTVTTQLKTKLCKVISSSAIFHAEFGLESQVTRLEVDSRVQEQEFNVRRTTVFLQSEKLELFQSVELKHRIEEKNGKTTIALDRVNPNLKPEQAIIISSSNHSGVKDKVVTIEDIYGDVDSHTVLVLKETLEAAEYEPSTLKIYANVVFATHGETIADEVLGSGDGTKANQQFGLKKPPLTYVSSIAGTGIQSTLKVYVNQVLWQHVQSLHNQDARSQCYIVQTNEQGQTRIIFGDGIRGARLPSGQENVRATYRSGIGHVGEVKAGSLILLQNRPLGIREVTNPLPAGGAADRDSFEIVRKNAPRTVLTLNHVVSLRDFENFARSFAGIGKAQASLIWTGEMRQIYITVADENGKAVPRELCNTLRDAIAAAGNALQPIQVVPYDPKEGLFNLEAKILVGDRYRFETVKPQIQQALSHAFSFHQREFGQGVAASQVIQIIQSVEGVVAVDLDALYLSPPNQTNQTKQASQPNLLESFLVAGLGRWQGGKAEPAQILLLNSTEEGTVLERWT